MKATLRAPAEERSGRAAAGAVAVVCRRFRQRVGDAGVLAALLLCCAPAARANQYGDFWYTTNGNCATITNYTGSGGTVSIPDKINGASVTCLADRSLQCNYSLTNVIIPDSVLSIGSDVFDYCRGLTNVTIGQSVTNIGSSAFSGCSGLTAISIPSSVATIADYAFAGCTRLGGVTVPDSVATLGSGVFSGCTGLTNAVIGKGATNIGPAVFQGCASLPAITVDASNPAYSAVGGVLFYQHHTTLSGYPPGKAGTSYAIPAGVTNIEDSAFYGCTNLASVTFPGSVAAIGPNAFYGCDGLASIVLSNGLTSIGSAAFQYCRGLTSIAIPDTASG
jgi:hypothetical protein